MADAARPAHLRLATTALALGLGLMPIPVHAHAAPQRPGPTPPADAASPTDEAPASPDPVDETATAPADETAPPPAEDPDPPGDEGSDAITDDAASDDADDGDDADVGDDADEPSDAEASDADDEATDDQAAATPTPGALGPTAAPLRPMQTAAWWTMFGAFAVGTTAGVLAGLAERQEDRATRLSTLFDSETGAQPLYADRQEEYERYLRRGEGYAKAALGVGVIAGATTVAAITLFAVDAWRQRGARAPERRRAALRVRGGGLEVRF